ncbi:MAG: LTA synthase family protein [Paraburkholderia sp.]|uniref:LTA synthase family protein n=1 Tax=Paraburkholderia sp. TaxID=1926495 RepID=UPI0011FBBD78|nr:LTA synthase family protein [Paraburkholderia sp.]TAM03966.1 MAG: LTA synthase family protein [Paraburkholderia sp.]TAM32047.1 MAG: LTA synthase family protein [Paraburkholderia sp.]
MPIAFVAAIALSLGADTFVIPRARLRRRPVALALHAVSVLFLICLTLAITRRPYFAVFVALALILLISAVSNAKYASLREPFVFTDLSLFSQLFTRPRLYLPFLSPATIGPIAVGSAVFVAVFFLDTTLPASAAVVGAAGAAACLALGYLFAARLRLSLDPHEDQRHHGFFPVFAAYLLNGMRPATFRAFARTVAAGPFAEAKAPSTHPDVIVIQSESFFDPRKLSSAIDPSLLKHFDQARRESLEHGRLGVPAWGANTMRSEFALLTGLASSQLGYARFYPYAFVRRTCASLAGWFRHAGYRTVAIHPFFADFFGRDRVFPLLQFDRFLDIRAFECAPRAGPYVSDAAVLDRIVALLDENRSQPAFIFAITMENHGPLHLESVEAGEAGHYHKLGEDPVWCDLTAYLRHVANADAMIGHLIAHLRERRRDTILCFYGDHVPALSHVFERFGNIPAHSNYFIWRNSGGRPARMQDRAVEDLGTALLHAMEKAGQCNASVSTVEKIQRP